MTSISKDLANLQAGLIVLQDAGTLLDKVQELVIHDAPKAAANIAAASLYLNRALLDVRRRLIREAPKPPEES